MNNMLLQDRENWLSRWRENRIGFHQDTPSPMLVECWDRIGAPDDARVFVPLAGKSVDMPWLAEHGYRVFGVELAELAVQQFFAEQQLEHDIETRADGTLYRSGPIELLLGNVFALGDELATCNAVFDRAAIIALPRDLRIRYAREVYGQLPRGCVGLMITLEYPQHQKSGPPFSVTEEEVRELFEPEWEIEVLVRRDILKYQQSFQDEGVTALQAVAYRMQKR